MTDWFFISALTKKNKVFKKATTVSFVDLLRKAEASKVLAETTHRAHFSSLVQSWKDSTVLKGHGEDGDQEKPSDKPVAREEAPPRSLLEIIKAAGSEGVTFEDIIRRYGQAAGLRSRKVNRTTIRYSLDKMVDSGRVKTLNRGGETVYVAGGGDKDGTDSERDSD